MSRRHWELKVDPPMAGLANMEIDAGLLAELERAPAPRTVLRFYAWTHPTLSLGRNQNRERAADLAFCERAGVEVVHRPTGGQAVLHEDEMTYAVVSNEPAAFDGGSVYGVYRRVSEALAEGYRSLGVDVALAGGEATGGRGRDEDHPCFVTPSRYELTVGGRKLVGSAQRRLRRAFLQHGSMPVSIDRELLAGATRFPDAGSLEGEMIGLAECLSPVPERGELIRAFARAFETSFGVVLDRGQPADTL
jgi:lipoate-protein ligase A